MIFFKNNILIKQLIFRFIKLCDDFDRSDKMLKNFEIFVFIERNKFFKLLFDFFFYIKILFLI